jgi:hypothetical protein
VEDKRDRPGAAAHVGEEILVQRKGVRHPAAAAVAEVSDQGGLVVPQKPDLPQVEGAEMAEVVGEVQLVAKGQGRIRDLGGGRIEGDGVLVGKGEVVAGAARWSGVAGICKSRLRCRSR